MVDREEVKKMREEVYQKARNYRIKNIMDDLSDFNNEHLCGIINGESKFLWADECFSDAVGWSVYELISKPIESIIHPQDLKKINELYKTKSNSVDGVLVRVKNKTDTYSHYNWVINYNKEKNCLYCYIKN